MKPYTCIIIDDELGAHRVLQNYISKLNEWACVKQFFNALEAYQFLKEVPVDLIFLDINLPELDGLAFIKMLNQSPQIIITSAYSEYAVDGFDLDVSDYLLKPIRFERFLKATEKAKEALLLKAQRETKVTYIDVKADGQLHRVLLSDVQYMQSIGNYIKIFLTTKNLITHFTTSEMEERLKGTSLIRVHKSFIVNTSYIKDMDEATIEIHKTLIPIGKTYKRYLDSMLPNFLNQN